MTKDYEGPTLADRVKAWDAVCTASGWSAENVEGKHGTRRLYARRPGAVEVVVELLTDYTGEVYQATAALGPFGPGGRVVEEPWQRAVELIAAWPAEARETR